MRSVAALLTIGVVFHLCYTLSVFDIYFRSPLVHGMTPVLPPEPAPADRVVLFVADGLRADRLFENRLERAPFLRSVVENVGRWGISHTRVPTESRPGHVAIITGFYEDVSAVTTGWQLNPVDFDSVFNQSSTTYSFGSPDILPMFAEGASDKSRVQTFMYDAHAEDFGIEASGLDTWVFDQVASLIEKANNDETLKAQLLQKKTVFFLHLLGLDTNGHAFKPHSIEYLNNIKLVDKGIQKTVDLLNEFYGNDGKTAYVFTADHGMSNMGNHGDGHPDNTRTPLIVWGAGISKPVPAQRKPADEWEEAWRLLDLERKDVQQADLAPLMSTVAGIPYPMNNVGILPASLLDGSSEYISRVLFGNAQQILQQLHIKEQQKAATSLLFRPYPHLKNHEERLRNIDEQIIQGKHEQAQQDIHVFMQDTLDGLRYYQTYDWLYLRSIITAGYVLWMGYSLLHLLSMVSGTKLLTPVFSLSFLSIAALVAWFAVLYYQQSPVQYYIYVFFPVYFLEQIVKERHILIHHLQFKASSLMHFVFYLGVLEALVVNYFHRELLTPMLLLMGAMYPLSFPKEQRKRSNVTAWILSCSLTAVFPLLPVEKNEAISLVVAGGLLALVFFWACRPHLTSSKKSWMLDAFQSLLLALSIIMVYLTDAVLKQKKGLPGLYQIANIAVSAASLSMIFVVRKGTGMQRVLRLLMAFLPTFVFLSVSYEVLFLVCFFSVLLSWVNLEGNACTQVKNGNSTSDFVISAFYMTLINLAFFGTGNMASLSSFSLESVYRYTTVFNPFLMSALLIFKILVPFFILSSVFTVLTHILHKPPFSLFLLMQATTDIMTLHFFYLVRDEGSWLDIGTSISHFVIASAFMVFQMGMAGVGSVLVGKLGVGSANELNKND